MIKDTYRNFKELQQDNIEWVDYSVVFEKRNSDVIIVAIHWWNIEPQTDYICMQISWEMYSYYCFLWQSVKYHITSNSFDEPSALELVQKHKLVISIHWLAWLEDEIHIWWKNKNLRDEAYILLRRNWFNVIAYENAKYKWDSDENICNRWNNKNWWLQIEISRWYREKMLSNLELLNNFVFSIRSLNF